MESDAIDLGEPLLDTAVCVKDGFLWIGGAERRCYVDDEVMAPELRCTGDRVEIEQNGRIVFVGREDDQLKRSGMRVNLTQIEQVPSMSLITSYFEYILCMWSCIRLVDLCLL